MIRSKELVPLVFLSVGISLWALMHTYLDQTKWPMVFSVLVLILAYRRVGRPLRLPRVLGALLVMLAIAMLVMGIFWLKLQPGRALAYFLTASILAKSLSIRRLNDCSELMLLSMLAMMASGSVSATTEYSLAVVAYFFLGGYWLYKSHLVTEALAHRQYKGPHGRGIVVSSHARTWMGGFVGTALLTCGIALAIFIVIPRHAPSLQILGLSLARQSTRTGYNEQLTLGEMAKLLEDFSPALRVKMLQDVRHGGYTPMLYLRGSVRTDYARQGRVWKWLEQRNESEEKPVHTGSGDGPPTTVVTAKEPLERQTLWRFFYEDEISTNLFVIDTPTAIRTGQALRLTYSEETNTLRATQGPARGFWYELLTEHRPMPAVPNRWAHAPNLGDWERVAIMYGLPVVQDLRGARGRRMGSGPDYRKYRRFVQEEILGRERRRLTAQEQARRIETYLRMKLMYDLDHREPAQYTDPVLDFLLRRRRGHCEYFASAMVLLARSIGLDARLVTGFKGGEYNSFGNYYLIRNCDAHAWAEIRFGDGPWITYDPTPPLRDELIRSPDSMVLKLVWDVVDLLRFSWLSKLANYDENERKEFIEGLKKQLVGKDKAVESQRFSTIRRFVRNLIDMLRGEAYQTPWQKMLHWFVTALIFLFIILAIRIATLVGTRGYVLVRNFLRAHWKKRFGNLWVCPVDFYRRALLSLATRGISKPVTRTAWEFAEQVRSVRGDLHEEFDAITAMYVDVRFGGHRMTDAERAELRRTLDAFHKKLSAGRAYRRRRATVRQPTVEEDV